MRPFEYVRAAHPAQAVATVAAALANAVYHATGRRVRNPPITLDKLLQ